MALKSIASIIRKLRSKDTSVREEAVATLLMINRSLASSDIKVASNEEISTIERRLISMSQENATTSSSANTFNEMERVVIDLVQQNMTDHDIAEKLNISWRDVLKFRRSAHNKLYYLIDKNLGDHKSTSLRDELTIESGIYNELLNNNDVKNVMAKEIDQRTTKLKALADVERRAAELAASHFVYRQQYAAQLEPIINERIKLCDGENSSYDEKKALIKSMNEELRLGGLAIQYESTDAAGTFTIHPAYFVIGTARNENGRFRVEYQDGGEKSTHGISAESPPLKLMPAPSQHSPMPEITEANSFTGRLEARSPAARKRGK